MKVSQSTLVLGAALVGAGGYALLRDASSSDAPRAREERPASRSDHGASTEAPDPTHADPGAGPGQGPGPSQNPTANDDPAAIAWTVPAGWRTLPNPSPMRIATYSVPHAASDTADAEVSVARAGGDVGSNIARWASQFEGAGDPKREVHKVRGLAVTMVEIEGTYTNAMAQGAKPRAGWALLGAIVETPGQPYFFKMTGPAATVHAAKGALTTLIDGIRPAG